MSAEEEEEPSSNLIIPVTLKWSKKTFDLQLDLRTQSALDFKGTVQRLTGVPIHRQKLLAKKGGWKGPLSDDFAMKSISAASNKNNNKKPSSLTVTLIGSAETLSGPTTVTTFVEDLTPEQIKSAERAELEAAMKTARGMIPALQKEPHKRDDNKTELYQYNHMVKGLPQRQIEDLLEERQKQKQKNKNESSLLGRVAMTMGLELRRAYVNDMAVLENGTLLSAFDDGHIQLWKHGAQQNDIIHPQGNVEGGVDSVVAWDTINPRTRLAFASAGRGSIVLWDDEGEQISGFQAAPIPGATSPTGLVCLSFGSDNNSGVVALAARFRITRTPNPHQFRIPPQNEQERQRRAQAEAQERALQDALDGISQSFQVWYSVGNGGGGGGGGMSLKSRIFRISNAGAGPITCLEVIPLFPSTKEAACLLVAGDAAGGLSIWRAELDMQTNDIKFQEQTYTRLISASSSTSCSIVTIKSLRNGMLAVSTTTAATSLEGTGGTPLLSVPEVRAVHILSLDNPRDLRVVATLNGHTDAVQCFCELPNGDLLTGGGKMDATVKLWSQKLLLFGKEDGNDNDETSNSAAMEDSALSLPRLLTEPTKTLPSSEIGYVFGLQLLPDMKSDSDHFAVAAARYNVVKIIL